MGNDTLDGGTGNDVMRGGAGDDTYVVDSAGDVVIEDAQRGTDTVRWTTMATYTLAHNVEYLTLHGRPVILWGLATASPIASQAVQAMTRWMAAPVPDRLAGGLGDDSYLVDSASDVVVEASNAGTDTVFADEGVRTLFRPTLKF